MSSARTRNPRPDNFAELVDQLGGISPARIWLRPAPGTATERDLIAALDGPNKRLCELVYGVLVEKDLPPPKPPGSTALDNLADLVERLGGIPLERIRFRPPLGTAKVSDVITAAEGFPKRLCELVDGVLVEKPMGTREALLASLIVHFLWDFLEKQDLGIALGADGAMRILPRRVRIPDVSFISWDRLPERELPRKRIANLAPDLAVEVLSEGNTKKEMERKLKEYFRAGVRLVWLIQPKTRTAEVYTSPTKKQKVDKGQSLLGGKVLPGFRLPLKQLFGRTRRHGER
jgi:Uma2 family endonuclease